MTEEQVLIELAGKMNDVVIHYSTLNKFTLKPETKELLKKFKPSIESLEKDILFMKDYLGIVD